MVLVAGCTSGEGLGEPQIKSVDTFWGNVSQNRSEIVTEITVYNPNSVKVPVKDIECRFNLAGLEMGNGSAVNPEIEAGTKSTLKIVSQLDNDKIPAWWVKHIKNNETSLAKMEGNVVFDLKVTTFEWPLSFSKKIEANLLNPFNSEKDRKIPKKPFPVVTVKETSSEWGEITSERTEINLEAKLRNEIKLPIPINKIRYQIEISDVKVGEGETEESYTIEPGEQENVKAHSL